MNSTRLILLAALAAMVGLLGACTDLQDQLPPTTTAGVNVHPDGWMSSASAEFHGKAVRAAGWDMTSCQTCHSSKYTGGTSGVTCATCHADTAGPEDCKTCHGGLNAAPPKDVDGNTIVTAPGVGAHQFHLVSATTGKLVVCAECHTVPAALADSGHIDVSLPADVPMGGALARLARNGITPVPSYNYTAHTCGGTYCHGNFVNGNTNNAPVWNAPAGTGAACGTCHGNTGGATNALKALPKTAATGGTHTAYTQCSWCHDTVVDAAANFVDGTKHVDGTVQLYPNGGSLSCRHCHGSTTSTAPPTDLSGNTSRTSPGVGAHQIHLTGGVLGANVSCSQCHVRPSGLDYTGADGHIDAAPGAELTFGALAGKDTLGVTADPSYSSANRTCAGTYCHGSFANGNPTNTPVWNGAAGTGAECGTCHGSTSGATTAEKALPKTLANGGTHPTDNRCSLCHAGVVNASLTITDRTKHVDGQIAVLQFSGPADCNKCHGTAANAAPPTDLSGNTATTFPGVGVHQAHVVGSSGATSVACAECHTVPSTLDYSGADGHLDAGTSTAELVFGSLSRKTTTGVTPNPSYTFAGSTCAGTYCHGSFANGNTTNAPTWTNASTGACRTCHGGNSAFPSSALPKTSADGGTHPSYTTCSWCHGSFDGSKHVNGTAELLTFSGPADCARCHGSGANAAPPNDLSGNVATTARGVGAHQVHLTTSTAKTVKCAECHTVPSTLDFTGADGHLEGTALAEVAMDDTLAMLITNAGASVPNPAYDPNTQSCSSTYCHGTFKWGNASNAPTWTNAASAACGTCHGNPTTGNPLPPAPHSTNLNCQNCHSLPLVPGEPPVATYNSVDGTWSITNAARHMNGLRNTFRTEGTY